MDENFVKYLMSAVSCSVCGAPYDGANVQVLGRCDDLWFLNVYCPFCCSEGTVTAILEKGQVAKLISDFAADDGAGLSEIEAIELDDVLGLHDFLEEFDGDFMNLFSLDSSLGDDDGDEGIEFY
jgi:hypothetical protein